MKQKEKDMVLIPKDWLPYNVLDLLSDATDGKSFKQAKFWTDDLNQGGELFYINNDGFLIHEDIKMAVVAGEPNINSGKPSLVVDSTHKPVLEHNLKKLYSQIMNKICILVVQFYEHKITEVQSIIRPCTQ